MLTNHAICPHCDAQLTLDRGSLRVMPVFGAIRPEDWTVYMIVCGECNKPVSSYTTPQRTRVDGYTVGPRSTARPAARRKVWMRRRANPPGPRTGHDAYGPGSLADRGRAS